jgi:hypothetical protein
MLRSFLHHDRRHAPFARQHFALPNPRVRYHCRVQAGYQSRADPRGRSACRWATWLLRPPEAPIRQNQTDAKTPRVSSTHKALQAIAGRSLDNFQSSHACEMEREGTRQCSSPESCNHYSPPTLRRRLRRQQRWLRGNAQERSPKTAHGAPRLVVLPLPAAHP